MEKHALFLLLALVSEIIGTVSGFGSSILFVPLASLFFDFKLVLAITAIFHVFSNLSKIALFRKGLDRNIVIKLGVPAVIFVTIGALFTTFFPSEQIELLMNVILVVLAVYMMINFNKIIKQSNRNLIIGGIASGFTAGIAGTGGAIRGITLAAFKLPKEVFIASSAFIDLGVDASRAVVYLGSGYFQNQYLFLLPFLMVIGLLGSFIGKLILAKTSETIFRYLVLGIIVLTAFVQIIHYMQKT